MKNMVTEEVMAVFGAEFWEQRWRGSAGLGSLDSISICQDSSRAEGSMFLLLHAFYVSALVGLVFPLTALDIRLRASYC